jgi:hypothetical protein
MYLEDQSYIKSIAIFKCTIFIELTCNNFGETLLVSFYYTVLISLTSTYFISGLSSYVQNVCILLIMYFNASIMEKTNVYLYSCFFWLSSLDLFHIVLVIYFLVPFVCVKHLTWIASAGAVKAHWLKIY